jgi:hypothetical protein
MKFVYMLTSQFLNISSAYQNKSERIYIYLLMYVEATASNRARNLNNVLQGMHSRTQSLVSMLPHATSNIDTHVKVPPPPNAFLMQIHITGVNS